MLLEEVIVGVINQNSTTHRTIKDFATSYKSLNNDLRRNIAMIVNLKGTVGIPVKGTYMNDLTSEVRNIYDKVYDFQKYIYVKRKKMHT